MLCASNFQLALAALVGAAITAAAGYCLHCRYITRLGGDLTISAASHLRRQTRAPAPARAGTGAGSASLPDLSAFYFGSRAGSASLSDISALYDGSRAEKDDAQRVVRLQASCALDADPLLQIPQGLPRLQLVSDGSRKMASSGSNRRVRPKSPKSPVTSTSAFGSTDGSDEDDDTQNGGKLENHYMNTNGKIEGEHKGSAVVENRALTPLAAATMIRSHSITNDLHTVQPDPVSADILRKESQQESFIKLLTAPKEIPSPDEIEVFKILQRCLELRECFLFREEAAPWEVINDPGTPKPNFNLFTYVPEPKLEHVFQMVGGVVHVYVDKDYTERIYPVADATTFFTELHYMAESSRA